MFHHFLINAKDKTLPVRAIGASQKRMTNNNQTNHFSETIKAFEFWAE